MSGYVLSPAAEEDLNELWTYVSRDSIEAADRLVDRIEEALNRLVEMPTIGHIHEDLADETLRVWRVYSYLIIYRPATQPLEIVRIVSGFRSLELL